MTVKAAVAPDLPESTLNADKLDQLRRLAEGLTAAELYWVAAWSASLAAQAQQGVAASAVNPAKQAAALTIVYGSQTGNARRLAEQLARRSEANGLPVRLLRADAYSPRELAKERYLAIVISTQGEGEPPDDSRGLVEFILGKRAPKLPSLHFSVLGLGDSSYAEFCAIGNRLDARLAELGAIRFAPLGAADVDIDTVAAPWLEDTLEQARELLKIPGSSVTTLHAVQRERARDDDALAQPLHSREQPFHANVLANQRIVSRDAGRDLRHIELSLAGSSLAYQPGDSLGVWARNPPAVVAQWLDTLGLDGGIDVTHDGRTLPLARWLKHEREITRLSRAFIVALASVSGYDELARLLRPEQSSELALLLNACQPIDLLRRYRTTWSADALIAALQPLTPRLYSIASSQARVGDEVHLTVSVVDYEAHGTRHWGAASTFLAEMDENGSVPVFIESNDRFRLPTDRSRDIVMIGPGTGVAPFRAFVQEREETAASGRNWLFFGNRHFAQDFLYQTEWQAALHKGTLHRLDLAFSRDTAEKIYVQQRLRERAGELYAWLENGAYLYVCGDSAHMAKDVHATLIDVAVEHGGHSPDDAKAWLADLMQQGRYARDVY